MTVTARRDPYALLPPAYHHAPAYDFTFGPEVAALCSQVGLTPDPEQAMVLDDIFGVGEDGLPACFEYGLVGPRQQLKTGILKMCAIGWLWVMDIQDVSWSAHIVDTSAAAQKDLVGMIDAAPVLRKRMATGRTRGVFTSRNDMRLELQDGRALRFSARTEDGGRGLTGSRVILDEALKLTAGMLGALLPTLTAMEDAQAVMASTAAKLDGVALRTKRDAGRSGVGGIGWAEWAAPFKVCAADLPDAHGRGSGQCEHWPPGHPGFQEGCALDDEDLWQAAMPLLGRRRANGTGLSLARVRELRKSMPPAEFMREFLGWWEEPGKVRVFGEGAWEGAQADHLDVATGLVLPGFPTPPDFQLEAIGVAVDADLAAASIVGAGRRVGLDGTTRKAVRVIASGPGYTWLVPRLKELREAFPRTAVVVDLGGPSGVLKRALADAVKPARRLTAVSFDQWKEACGNIWDEIRNHRTEHGAQPELEASVAKAEKRKVVDRWVWERYGYSASALEAATLAAWAVDNTRTASAYEDRGVMTV